MTARERLRIAAMGFTLACAICAWSYYLPRGLIQP